MSKPKPSKEHSIHELTTFGKWVEYPELNGYYPYHLLAQVTSQSLDGGFDQSVFDEESLKTYKVAMVYHFQAYLIAVTYYLKVEHAQRMRAIEAKAKEKELLEEFKARLLAEYATIRPDRGTFGFN